jgi:Bacteriophage HK97-gp10, putative tail-component
MATKVKVVINDAGVIELLNDPGVVNELESRMSRVESAAKAGAPVESGDYQASIRMWTERHSDRTVVKVGSDVPYAMIVEAATGNLARSLDAAGGG